MTRLSIATSTPVVVTTPQSDSDSQLIAIWLHGRSPHTQRAHAADVARLCSRTGKPLAAVTLPDLQDFADSVAELSPASRYRLCRR